MPREKILGRYDAQTESYVSVGWGRETEHVQLATVVPAEVGRLAMWDSKTEEWIPIETGEEAGWFVQMNRYSINQLIKSLRKARDAAFGRDE